MINYTWKIHSITKKTVNNIDSVVFAVVWEKFGLSDDGYSGSIKSSANFNIDDIDENSFVPYDQLIEEVLPELVKTGENKSVNYNGIVGVLIEAIKEQQVRIEELEKKVNA